MIQGMMETDQLNEAQGVGREDGCSPNHPSGKPMRQLEFNQAMSDFRHMFPETDEEVIEAVLRANSGMVDATIDQLLTMNIDAEQVREMYEDDDDLSDHILVSVEQEVMVQEQGNRESRMKKRHHGGGDSSERTSRKEVEDCPPSYTEAVKSHLSHHHHRSGRHRHSPTTNVAACGGLSANASPKNSSSSGGGATTKSVNSGHHHHHHRYNLNGMQHLLDLGPESALGGGGGGVGASATAVDGHGTSRHGKHHSHHSSSSHRRHDDSSFDPIALSSPHHKVRPGRNLLASNSMSASHSQFQHHSGGGVDGFGGYPRPRKSSLDSNDFHHSSRSGREKSPSRWRMSHKEKTSPKRPAYRNWNPPLLGTLPDDFLRITPSSTTTIGAISNNPSPSHLPLSSVSYQPGKQSNTPHLHRTFSAVGPERPKFSSSTVHGAESRLFQSSSVKHKAPHKPHRSLSFAGHSSESVSQRKAKNLHPSGLAQHEFSQDFLQERMKENERRRLRMGSSGLDPELAQYLADERLAIMLQNSEFLQELRGDQQFMMTLERDHKDMEEGISRTDVQPEPVSFSALNSDEEEGYGEDRRDNLEAFPFTQQLPPNAKSDDVELRKKLKHMGKASKKQFAALAKKFFTKRKKKTAHQILKESQAPSMMNLLDEEDDDDRDFDDLDSIEPLRSSNQYDQDVHSSSRSNAWGNDSSRRSNDLY